MYDYYECMESFNHTKLAGILSDAPVSVHYGKDMTERQFKMLLPRVFDLFFDLTPVMEGELDRCVLPDGIQRIHITRGINGPLFNPRGPALYVRDTTVTQIEKKFSKKYKCDCPVELIVHSRTKPLPPEQLWSDEVHKYVRREIERSPFHKVWVFDYVQSTISYVYPDD